MSDARIPDACYAVGGSGHQHALGRFDDSADAIAQQALAQGVVRNRLAIPQLIQTRGGANPYAAIVALIDGVGEATAKSLLLAVVDEQTVLELV